MKSPIFEVTIVDQHSLILPDEIVRPFKEAGHQRVLAKACFNGKEVDFHAALQNDKNGLNRMTFGKTLQKKLGVFINDYFELQLFEDRSKYGVEMPEELNAVFQSDQEAFDRFEMLTPGRQRSIIYSIKRYKNSQTRIDKSLMVGENLKKGISDLKLILKHN
ncbi:MAG: YdeI/OmpD-associated family protein [Bacteroidia bacterium]|nr:YdeI/OmpD-associated family protein [Bacteroidia bacterium]